METLWQDMHQEAASHFMVSRPAIPCGSLGG
jgi:hypothetical protein